MSRFNLFRVVWIYPFLGSFSNAQVFVPDENQPPLNNHNVIQSVNGANVVLNDTVIAEDIWQPMFFWYWQLLNVALKFFPVLLVVSMFRLIYWYLKKVWNKNSLDSKKDLNNK